MEKYIEIGQRLKELRGSLSQKEFAEKLGISFAAYQNYEYGKRVPPGSILARIARMCHVTTDYILTGDIELLRKHVEEKKSDLAFQEGAISALNDELRRKLSKKIPVPQDIDSLINMAIFYKKHDIDIIHLIEEYLSEKFNVENILTDVSGRQSVDVGSMKKVIESVERTFEKKKLYLKPKTKADLIILLYDEMKKIAGKEISDKRILKAYENLVR